MLLKKIITNRFFIYLLLLLWPLYFVIDKYNQFRGLVSITDSLQILLIVTASATVLFLILRYFLNTYKGLLITWWFLVCYLFFKIILDKIVFSEKLKFLYSSIYFLPLFFVATLIAVSLITKFSNNRCLHFLRYLILLSFVLLCFEGIRYSFTPQDKILKPLAKPEINFKEVNFQKKPDIYLFVMDEYSGFESLRYYYNFSNDAFKKNLENRGFFVASRPSSNYNLTAMSVFSMLQMSYAAEININYKTDPYIHSKAIPGMQNNNLFTFFRQNGYKIINNSPFTFDSTESEPYYILPFGKRLLLDKTFGNLAKEGFLMNIPSNKIQTFLNTRFAATNKYNERAKEKLTESLDLTNSPVFIYSHFFIPHLPYVKDSSGTTKNFAETYTQLRKQKIGNGYLDNLKYANQLLLELINKIQQKSPEAIIIITSDHGNRFLFSKRKTELDFSTFFAVYKKDANYKGFTDTTTTVNIFRALLNNTFEQNLQILENKNINVAKGLL